VAGIVAVFLAACSPSLAPPPGAWLPLPQPPVGLVNPAVLALGHGSVLVLAGQSVVSGSFPGALRPPLSTVEEFASGTWHLRAPEPEALSDSGIVILPNDDVLLVGGVDGQERAVPRAYLYDPAADRWSRTPDLPVPIAAPFATLLQDGTVLVGGGASAWPNDSPRPSGLSSAWIFDPAKQDWRSIKSMHTGRLFASATRLPDGTVLVAGGEGDGSPLASAEVFDPATTSWTVVAPLPQAREQHAATLIGGKVVLMGGTASTVFGGGFALNAGLDAEIFDVGSKSWSLGSPPSSSVSPEPFAAVAPMADHRLLILTQPLPQAIAYDVGADYWSRITRPPSWQTAPTLSNMANGQVLLLAGKSAWRFDPNGNVPSTETGFGRETVVLSLIAGGLLLLLGVQRFFRAR